MRPQNKIVSPKFTGRRKILLMHSKFDFKINTTQVTGCYCASVFFWFKTFYLPIIVDGTLTVVIIAVDVAISSTHYKQIEIECVYSTFVVGTAFTSASASATATFYRFCFQTANQTLDKFNLRPLLAVLLFKPINSALTTTFYLSGTVDVNVIVFVFFLVLKQFFGIKFWTIVSSELKLGFCLNCRWIENQIYTQMHTLYQVL